MKIVIFGAGTLAEIVHYYITKDMKGNVIAFIVDEINSQNNDENILLGLPIYSWDQFLKKFSNEEVGIFVAIAYKNLRNKKFVFNRFIDAGYKMINVVSKSAYISEKSIEGVNNLILPNVVIEPNSKIGSNNIIWWNSTICHDVEIGNHNFFASNIVIGGKSKIGDLCFMGFASTIADYIQVDSGSHSWLVQSDKSDH